jgi:predicted HTH domain antitoxin
MNDFDTIDEDLFTETLNVALRDQVLVEKFKAGEVDLSEAARYVSFAVYHVLSKRIYDVLFSERQLNELICALERHELFSENSENI